MKSSQIRMFLGSVLLVLSLQQAVAQPTVRFDATKTHQRITGFGAFVCSPQFQYNHMSTAEIKKVWGTSSVVGCNIMRLYIPIGKNSWDQSLATAKLAKQMGLMVFASPWGQPAEWKTNGTINAKNEDGTTGKLKRENWGDYAQYLEEYVQYLRENGVELDAISIQNEPDWPATYAGCLWSASEIAEFVRLYGKSISCKVMAPETLSVNDDYANALNTSSTLEAFDIYGGHQYGGIQSAYKKLAAKGKEIWMTEYLINWNEVEDNTRNFDFTKDFFNFFRAINVCMEGDFNAWIHYAAKRYYGPLSDGQRGAGTSGTVTKRGYVMAHFAKYVTGMTRIDIDFGTTPLEGSAYIAETGDTVVAVVANDSGADAEVVMDLPFYTQGSEVFCTSKTKNMAATHRSLENETCRPAVTVAAQSVTTLRFVKSRDRQPSNMKGSSTRFDRLDDMSTTKSSFGTTYKLSGKTRTFDHSNPLISARTNAASGYVALDDRYSRLVLEVKKVTSTMNYSSAKTTLIYVNAAGQVASHDYGDLNLDRHENFTLSFDLSPTTLPDGCRGLISLTNNNWSSTLTLTLGTVFLDNGSGDYAAQLSGDYVEDDSYVQEYTSDPHCTSLDLTACTGSPSQYPWLQGTNRVVWLLDMESVGGRNLVYGDLCHWLELSTEGGDFRPKQAFTAEEASLTTTVEGCRLLMIPFAAKVPEGVKVYGLSNDLNILPVMEEPGDMIPVHTPVLVIGRGTVTFTGSGEVSFAKSSTGDMLHGTYTSLPLYTGDYVLAEQNGQWGFRRVEQSTTLSPFNVYATLPSQEAFIPLQLEETGITEIEGGTSSIDVFDLTGRRIAVPLKGVYIKNGKKIMIK